MDRQRLLDISWPKWGKHILELVQQTGKGDRMASADLLKLLFQLCLIMYTVFFFFFVRVDLERSIIQQILF